MTSSLIEQTSAFKTIQAYRDVARENQLVLRESSEAADSGDFPFDTWSQLQYIKRAFARGVGEPKTIVKSIHRQFVKVRDDKSGRKIKKDVIWYNVEFDIKDSRGIGVWAGTHTIGKYKKPIVVPNSNVKYDRDTGKPIGPEKDLSSGDWIYEIEVGKSKAERKKQYDEILGDTYPEEVLYYFNNEGEELGRSDSTYSYSDHIEHTTEELKDLSYKGGGSLTPGYFRDNDGILRDKFGQKLSNATTGVGGYQ